MTTLKSRPSTSSFLSAELAQAVKLAAESIKTPYIHFIVRNPHSCQDFALPAMGHLQLSLSGKTIWGVVLCISIIAHVSHEHGEKVGITLQLYSQSPELLTAIRSMT